MCASVSRTERKLEPKIARELLRRQGCTGIERAAVRPGVEIVQLTKIINRHANSFSKLEVRPLNFGMATEPRFANSPDNIGARMEAAKRKPGPAPVTFAPSRSPRAPRRSNDKTLHPTETARCARRRNIPMQPRRFPPQDARTAARISADGQRSSRADRESPGFAHRSRVPRRCRSWECATRRDSCAATSRGIDSSTMENAPAASTARASR